MTSQNSVVLLNRLLSLKDNNPFMLVLDSLSQSSYYFVQEVAYQTNSKIVYLSFETINKPSYASEFIDCTDKTVSDILNTIQMYLSGQNSSTIKILFIIDSLNYILSEELTALITNMMAPGVSILATYHTNLSNFSNHKNYPTAISLLSYIASSIFELDAIVDETATELLDEKISKLQFPIKYNLNESKFKVTLTTRRKSGRSLIYKYIFNSITHVHETFKEKEETVDPEDESLLKDLTTFNLTTNSKQRIAREQVELPYMQAQESLGSSGGAIVYEFEKDDDYDEEDPYEDPF